MGSGLRLALLLVPACSWALVEQPPRYDRGVRPLSCTTRLAAPIADTVLAIALTAAATTLLVTSHDARPTIGVGIGGLLAAVPYGFSAGYGYAQTERCRRLASHHASGLARHQAIAGDGATGHTAAITSTLGRW